MSGMLMAQFLNQMNQAKVQYDAILNSENVLLSGIGV